jgi:O-methyltransferase involved in polyketide biosynthesis
MENYSLLTEGNVPSTMLIPLWGRAYYSKIYPEILNDDKAINIVNKLNYDFTRIKNSFGEYGGISIILRASEYDRKIKEYIKDHPEATIVNIGSGLDTTFFRVNNGKINWYDIDLPEAIKLRKTFIKENNKLKFIAKSVLDYSWFDLINYDSKKGIMFIASGIFCYFTETQVKELFVKMAYKFKDGEILFDINSKVGMKMSNFAVRKSGSNKAPMKFFINDCNKIERWSNSLKVKECYSFYRNIKKDPRWKISTVFMMKFCDVFSICKYIRIKFN